MGRLGLLDGARGRGLWLTLGDSGLPTLFLNAEGTEDTEGSVKGLRSDFRCFPMYVFVSTFRYSKFIYY